MQTIQIRQTGSLTLPASLLRKYNVEPGDLYHIIDRNGSFVLEPLLTIDQTAKRVGVTSGTIRQWIEREALTAVETTAGLMIPVEALAKYDRLNNILDALDEDRPPATDEEISRVLESGRKDWTWIGKEE